jgi:dihydropyrimidine dehydrogenase (NAD+) subunit PreA
VRGVTNLPILAKMTPNITEVVPSAKAAIKGGVNGIATINTIKSLTGFLSAIDTVDNKTAVSGYSGKNVSAVSFAA